MQSGHFLAHKPAFLNLLFNSPGHKLPHVSETEIDKIRVITGNGIGIKIPVKYQQCQNSDARLFEEF
jgi:hypothetical protein